ncbi:hypothetical protein [Marinimicrobium agarilyticum]|uniref:hypothetical protein n=1 Tax=Marinimicrobium agarilyticum TaxID=306546 RepID=UPI0004119DBF|nr:hypothetical protein [Marinimicrobium agarilyticum]
MNDAHGLKAAEILDFPKDAMLLSLAAERAMNTPNAKEIRRLAEQHYPRDYPKSDDIQPSEPDDIQPPHKAHRNAS